MSRKMRLPKMLRIESEVTLIRQRAPETEIIILTLYESLDMARTAALKGATVYITKSLIVDVLVPAIESLQSELNLLHREKTEV